MCNFLSSRKVPKAFRLTAFECCNWTFYSTFIRHLSDYRLRNAKNEILFITQNLTKETPVNQMSKKKLNWPLFHYTTNHLTRSSRWRFGGNIFRFVCIYYARMCQKIHESVSVLVVKFHFRFLFLSGFIDLKKVRVDLAMTGWNSCLFLRSKNDRISNELDCLSTISR